MIDERRKNAINEARGWCGEGEPRGWAVEAPSWPHARLGHPMFEKVVALELRQFAGLYDGGTSGLLLGKSGVGKTTAALATVRHLAAKAVEAALALPSDDCAWFQRSAPGMRLVRSAKWTTAAALARARREHGLGRGDAPLVVDSTEASLLVVDEAGFEPRSEVLFEVIDARYTARRPTLVTSGLSAAAFEQHYGAALFRRLVDDGIGTLVEVGANG